MFKYTMARYRCNAIAWIQFGVCLLSTALWNFYCTAETFSGVHLVGIDAKDRSDNELAEYSSPKIARDPNFLGIMLACTISMESTKRTLEVEE